MTRSPEPQTIGMRNVAKTVLWFALAVMVALCASCGKGRVGECEKHIKDEIHVGTSVETAEAALRECSFRTSVDFSKHLLYGDKVVEGLVVLERTQVTVDFGTDKKVASVTVSKGLIGP